MHFSLNPKCKSDTVYSGHSGHDAILPDTTDNLIPAEELGESRAEWLTIETAGEMQSITVSVENELILQTGSGTFQS